MQFRTLALGFLLSIPCFAAGRQDTVDPALRAVVDRFFAAQQAEDVDGYLTLWSASAARPAAAQLKYIFDLGDDTFSEVSILRVTPFDGGVRVRVAATRDRTEYRGTGRVAVTFHTRMLVTLTVVQEPSGWKLLREGPASDELADQLIATPDAAERVRLIERDSELLNESLVESLSRRGGAAAQTQAFPAAKAAYERTVEVARRLGDRKAEAEALQNLGTAQYFLGQLASALDAYEQRLAIDRERKEDAGIAAALLGIATIRYSYAEYGTALGHYREALAIQERLNDEAGVATTLISTGNVAFLQGDFETAIADYRRSRELHRKLLNTLGEAWALEGLGRTLAAQGDLGGALEAFGGVLEEARARGIRPMQGNASASIGEVHFRLGNLEAARASFVESRTHLEAAGDAGRAARVWQQIALTDLVRGALVTAEQEYAMSAAICTKAADGDCVAGATVGLAFARSAQEKFTEAIPAYEKAIAMFSAADRREQAARAEIGLAQALSGAGQYAQATEAATRSRRIATGLDQQDVLWRALVEEARALGRSGAKEAALGVARASLYSIAQLHERANARPGQPVPRDTSVAFGLVALLQVETGDPSGALDTIERMRMNDLRAAIAPNERDIAKGMTSGERQQERALAAEVASIAAQIARTKGLPRPDPSRIESLEKTFADATGRRSTQLQRVFQRLPDLRLWRGLVDPATRSDIAGLLPDGRSALLELVVDDDALMAVSARTGESGLEVRAGVTPIARKLLAERVGQLGDAAAARDADAWRRIAVDLARLFPSSVTEHLADATRVTIVPHDLLWRVPVEALPFASGFLAGHAAVTYAASATPLPRAPEAPAHEGPAAAVAIAPEIGGATRDRVARTVPGWRLGESGRAERALRLALPETAGETGGAGIVWIVGSDATERRVRDGLGAADIVYLAAPSRVNGASPLFSSTLLADAGDDPVMDGALEAREVTELDLAARAAVFTDGDVLAMREAADDLGVVQWAWRAAGVKALVTPRWPQDEAAQAAILLELHTRLRAGESPADALHHAQAKVRNDPRWAAPVYWAGWVVTGGR